MLSTLRQNLLIPYIMLNTDNNIENLIEGSISSARLYDLSLAVFWELAPYARVVDGEGNVDPCLSFYYGDTGYTMFKTHCMEKATDKPVVWSNPLDLDKDDATWKRGCLALFGNEDVEEAFEPANSAKYFERFEKDMEKGSMITIEMHYAFISLYKP